MDRDQLQAITLRLLLKGQVDARLGRGEHYLSQAIRGEVPEVTRDDVQQVFWSLVSQGLAYIDFSQRAVENWELRLTDAGRAAARDEEFNPNDPAGYISRLVNDVPEMSQIVRLYAYEALHAYNHQLFLASSVMLGVASEAAFLELGEAFANSLTGNNQNNFLASLRNVKQSYLTKFQEFRKRLEPLKSSLPDELSDGLDLWLSSVSDLLRIYRNDAGHPTGRHINRDDCFINLRMFARYMKKMYQLKTHFESS